MEPDYTKFGYHSDVNYLKKDLGVSEPAGQSFNTSDTSASVITKAHDFGYRPNIEFAADVANEGIIWMGGGKVEARWGGSAISPATWTNPRLFPWVDNNNFYIGQYFIDFGTFVDRDVLCKWNIYRDFGDQ